MRNSLLDNSFYKRLILFKPSTSFWITAIFCFSIWIYLGPLNWRHYDDYDPLNNFLSWLGVYGFTIEPNSLPTNLFNTLLKVIGEEAKIIRLILVSIWAQLGWGTYPPIWNSIYLSISSPFIIFGIDASRWVLIILGFLSNLISACLFSSIIIKIFITFSRKYHFNKTKQLSDFLSVLLITLNPQILLHSQTYMPYQLPIITTLLFLNFISSEYIQKNELLFKEKYIFKFSNFWATLFIVLSLIIGYQILIIVPAFILYNLQNNNFLNGISELKLNFVFKKLNLIRNINKSRFFLEKIFHKQTLKKILNPNESPIKSFLILILIFATLAYIYQFLRLFVHGLNAGDWSIGENGIYNLQYKYLTFKNAPNRIYEVISRLCSLSLYPFRDGQSIFGFFSIILIIFSWINLDKSFKNFKDIKIFCLDLLFVSLIFSFFGKFNLSPTRHSLFIFPIFWIPIIVQLIKYLQYFEISKVKRLIKITSILLIIIFYSFGSIKSFNQIKYTDIERNELISMASEADLFASSDGQYDYSLYWTHGSKEFKSVQNKNCKDSINKSISRTAFLYSHRSRFIPSDLEQINFLENTSSGCISSNSKISIIKSIERNNRRSFEMDNRIDTGGSSLYGYLIKVN